MHSIGARQTLPVGLYVATRLDAWFDSGVRVGVHMGVATCVRGSEKREAWLISLRAGGAGIDLTAADYVILPNPWWNPAVEAQAIDRAHRIGRDGTVIAYRLIAERQTIRRELDPALESEGLVHRLEYPFELCWKPVEE